jgi:hypothetical protein
LIVREIGRPKTNANLVVLPACSSGAAGGKSLRHVFEKNGSPGKIRTCGQPVNSSFGRCDAGRLWGNTAQFPYVPGACESPDARARPYFSH